jgi:hypothetical protein
MPSHGEMHSVYLALLSGLWAEMEDVLRCYYAVAADSEDALDRAARGIEALLLELALLWDKCEFLRARGLVTPEHATWLRALIEELRDLLDFEPFDVALPRAGVAIVRAQNRVFDEVQRVVHASGSSESAMATLQSMS